MLNLVKMNVYRLFKSKNWIALLVVLLMAFTVSAIEIAMQRSDATETVVNEDGTEVTTYTDEEGGVYIEAQAVDLTISEVYASFNGEFTLLVIGIFAVVYCENERKHGFVKNLSVRKKDKALVFASKIAPAFVFSIATIAVSFIGVLLGSVAEGGIPMGDVAGMIKYSCVAVLLCTAFIMFSMALYELFRKNVAAVLISAFTAVGLIPQLVFYGEIGLIKLGILSERFASDLDITQHMITMRFNTMNYANMFANKPNNIVIALIGIAVYLTIGMLLYRKKDVV